MVLLVCFFFSSRRRHTRSLRDWSSDVCSSDLVRVAKLAILIFQRDGFYPCVPMTQQDSHPLVTLDRKSTRLNSSHVEISYAVFCLKKKKKTQSSKFSNAIKTDQS